MYFITSSGIAAVLTILQYLGLKKPAGSRWEKIARKMPSPYLYAVFLLLVLLWSTYRAWLDEYRAFEAAKSHLVEKRLQLGRADVKIASLNDEIRRVEREAQKTIADLNSQLHKKGSIPPKITVTANLLPENPKDERYVQATPVRPALGKGKYALIVEFGVRRHAVDGIHVGINVTGKYTLVEEWLALPHRTDVPETRVITVTTDSAVRREPPIYARRFSFPSVTPKTSYYMYFESEEPLSATNALFKAFRED